MEHVSVPIHVHDYAAEHSQISDWQLQMAVLICHVVPQWGPRPGYCMRGPWLQASMFVDCHGSLSSIVGVVLRDPWAMTRINTVSTSTPRAN